MKKLIFVFFAFLHVCTLWAQVTTDSIRTTLLISPKDKTGTYHVKPVATYDSSYVFVLPNTDKDFGGNAVRIQKIDKNLKQATTVTLRLKDQNGMREYCNLIYFNNKLWLLTSYNNTKEKRVYLFANTLNKSSLQVNDDIRMIASFDHNMKRRSIALHSDIEISPDSSKLMLLVHGSVINRVYFQNTNISDKNLENVESSICVFNREMFKIWQSSLNKAIDSNGFIKDKMLIDNSGNCYVSGQSYKSSSDANYMARFVIREKLSRSVTFELQPTNFVPSILYFSKNGLEGKELDLKIPSCFLKNMNFKVEGKHLFCYGAYSDSSFYSAKGVFTCRVDLFSGSLSNVHLNPFHEKLRVPMLEETELKEFRACTLQKKDWDPYDYDFSDLIPCSDGNYKLIAEQQLWGYVMESIGRDSYTYPHYDYGNLYVLTMSPDGEIKNTSVIARKQTTVQEKTTSYRHFVKGEDLYFLFMNFHRIERLTYITEPINLCLVKLDAKGKSSISILEKYENTSPKSPFASMNAGYSKNLIRMDAVLPLPEENAFLYLSQNGYYTSKTFQKVQVLE